MKLHLGILLTSYSYFVKGDSEEVEFTYPSTGWTSLGECSGSNQSPIDLGFADPLAALGEDPINAAGFMKNLLNRPFKFKYDASKGHSLRFNFRKDYRGIDGDLFNCAQFHVHVGSSEHAFRGAHAFGEVHLVCYKKIFDSYDAAVAEGSSGNLAVFASLIDVKPDLTTDNDWFNRIIEAEADGVGTRTKLQIPMPAAVDSFYRYEGSLTTPTCNEVVTWTVFKHKVYITQAQADAMTLNFRENLKGNARLIQDLNGREVTSYQRLQNDITGVDGTIRPDGVQSGYCIAAKVIKAGKGCSVQKCDVDNNKFLWNFNADGTVQMVNTDLCWSVNRFDKQTILKLAVCDGDSERQQFHISDEGTIVADAGLAQTCIKGEILHNYVKYGPCVLQTWKPRYNECVCLHGFPTDRFHCDNDGDNKCSGCHPYYHLNDGNCELNECSCNNGDVVDDMDCHTHLANECSGCDEGFTLNGFNCDST